MFGRDLSCRGSPAASGINWTIFPLPSPQQGDNLAQVPPPLKFQQTVDLITILSLSFWQKLSQLEDEIHTHVTVVGLFPDYLPLLLLQDQQLLA